MKHIVFALLLCIFYTFSFAQTLQQIENKRVKLPNGWSLTPVGKGLPLGDLPLNLVVSSSGKYAAVTNNGQSVQSIQLFDVKNQKQLHAVTIPKAWYGLQFSSNEKYLYASGGNDNRILQYEVVNNKLRLKDSLILGAPWPTPISPTGLTLDDKKNLLYVVTKDDKSLYIFDLLSKKVVGQYELPGEGYMCLLAPQKDVLYISCWGCDKVLSFDLKSKIFKPSITVGDNPNEMAVTKNGRYLYVCNANDNTVSVIDLIKNAVIETLNTALYADALTGSTPDALALSKDEKTLYIANADNNCLTVFNVSTPGLSKAKGFIPTGWYPTNVKVVDKNIWITNGKGFSSMANPKGPNPIEKRQHVNLHAGDDDEPEGVQYIAGLFKGTLSIIPEPNEQQLFQFSKAVYNNTPYTKGIEAVAQGREGNPVPVKLGQPSPIKYVFYVIKENRTYDQVLGDIPDANGDLSLVLFGEKITPNQHSIARNFVLLDNFYVDAEVSADGHAWTMGAYATDFLEKTWPTSYGNRGGGNSAQGRRDVANNKGGYIWNACKKSGVSYRSYGEFADNYKPNIQELKDHVCPYYTMFDMSVKDTTRFFQWKRDFDSLLAAGAVPSFNSIRMGTDHTEGLRKGRPTPFAHVADNDLAVGMLVDYLSKSSIWNETAIFMIEDDAQNGADHVDAHRSTAYVAGGFVKRGFVDHTAYTTTSMLRTMELILGIPPMTQYDAAAVPMWRCFDTVAKPSTFVLKQSNINLNEKNVAVNKWQKKSEKFDLTKEDAVPDLEFNEVLWHAVKGEHIPFPGAKRSAFLRVQSKDDDDD